MIIAHENITIKQIGELTEKLMAQSLNVDTTPESRASNRNEHANVGELQAL